MQDYRRNHNSLDQSQMRLEVGLEEGRERERWGGKGIKKESRAPGNKQVR